MLKSNTPKLKYIVMLLHETKLQALVHYLPCIWLELPSDRTKALDGFNEVKSGAIAVSVTEKWFNDTVLEIKNSNR